MTRRLFLLGLVFIGCACPAKQIRYRNDAPCVKVYELLTPYCRVQGALTAAEEKVNRGLGVTEECRLAEDYANRESDPALQSYEFTWLAMIQVRAGHDPTVSLISAQDAVSRIRNPVAREAADEYLSWAVDEARHSK